MSLHKLDLNSHAPTAVDCEACQNRLIERLMRVTGIRSARVSEKATLEVEVDGSNGQWQTQASQIGAALADGVAHAHLQIGGLDCPNCASEIDATVREMDGVSFAETSFTGRRLAVEFDPRRATTGKIAAAVRRLGFSVEGDSRRFPTAWRLAATGAVFALAAARVPFAWALYLLVVLAEGRPIFVGAIASLRRRTVSMNVLMALALVGAAALGDWSEAASVAWLAALGAAIQDWATGRTRSALDQLIRLTPQTARIDGNETPVENVEPGDMVEVHAGERFPLDGEVVSGMSDADEAPITGEALPVPKSSGSQVFAGAVNLSGTLTVRVTKPNVDSALARMIRMIEQAQERRAPIQTSIDSFAAVYTPVVVLLALALAILPPLVTGAAWQGWIERGLWLLVVACPCALIVSTPVAIVSAIGAASRLGAIVKGGTALEALARVRTVVFDKTGTLTMAELSVTYVDSDDVLSFAAALERHSGHPVAKAICAEAARRGLEVPAVEDVQTVPGCGVSGKATFDAAWDPTEDPESRPLPTLPRGDDQLSVEESGSAGGGELLSSRGKRSDEGPLSPMPVEASDVSERDSLLRCGMTKTIRVGRLDWLGQTAVATPGEVSVGVEVDGSFIGAIRLADKPRADAPNVVRELSSLGIERIAMLSGDSQATATKIASETGIDEAVGGLLPADKEERVHALEADAPVMMVGDGINDLAAMARASVGVAMGAAGVQAAAESAPVVLMNDNLSVLPQLIRLGRSARRVMRQNIAVSLALKVGLVFAAIPAPLPLWMAVVGDVGVTVLVTLNAARLLISRS